jgi:hypothetical protein
MISTVFTTSGAHTTDRQRRLLEFSWHRAGQPGELVHLLAAALAEPPPARGLARVITTTPWRHHPYTGDFYPAYDSAAAVLEWLFDDRPGGTVLLVEPSSVLTAPVSIEVEPGRALGAPWPAFPSAESGPFGLGSDFAFLERYCVNSSLPVDAVCLPVLIHARDLRKMAARWLELMSIIRAEAGPGLTADRVAYAVAAAEYRIRHQPTDLSVGPDDEASAPIIDYRTAVTAGDGEVVWNPAAGEPWQAIDPQRAGAEAGRQLLKVLRDFVEFRDAGGELRILKPQRTPGVREARVADNMVLEIPGRPDSLSLNPSAAAIWQLCDSAHSLLDIASELEARHQLEPGALREDVVATIDLFVERQAIELVMR